MRVLVLGGTGAMGVHLISIFSDLEIESVVTSRRNRESRGCVKYVQGDARDVSFLNTLLAEKWDAIVDFMVYSTSEFKERFEDLLTSTNQYVFLSSSRVFAQCKEPITEESPRLLDVCEDKDYIETDEYGLAKARQEDILKNSDYNNWTVIRPSVTFSENRLQLGELEKEYWLQRALSNRTIVVSKDIMSKYATLTYGYDVSMGISGVVGKSEALSQVYNLTVSESYKWEEILSVYQESIKKKTGVLPKVLMLEKAPLPDRHVVKYDKVYDRQYDNAKIDRLTDFNNVATKTISGLQNCMDKFLDNPFFLPVDWKKVAFLDSITKEFTPLSEIKSKNQKITYLLFRYVLSYRLLYKIHRIIGRYKK